MRQRIADKNGEVMAEGIKTRLLRVGRAAGIVFDFEGRLGSTRDAHRLLWRVGKRSGGEAQTRLAESLFAKVFEEKGDVTRRADLVDAATRVGVERGQAEEWLESGVGGEEVDEEARGARESGVRHVPTFEVNGRRIEGAEDGGVFYEAFVAVKEREMNVVPRWVT